MVRAEGGSGASGFVKPGDSGDLLGTDAAGVFESECAAVSGGHFRSAADRQCGGGSQKLSGAETLTISTKSLPEQQKIEAATTEKEGQIQFYITIGGTLVPDEDAESFVARIQKLTPSTETETENSAELTEDWRAMGKALGCGYRTGSVGTF